MRSPHRQEREREIERVFFCDCESISIHLHKQHTTITHPINSYPSVIVPGQLFLGDWADAEAADRLAELGIKR